MKAFKPTDSWGPNDIELSTKVKEFAVFKFYEKRLSQFCFCCLSSEEIQRVHQTSTLCKRSSQLRRISRIFIFF